MAKETSVVGNNKTLDGKIVDPVIARKSKSDLLRRGMHKKLAFFRASASVNSHRHSERPVWPTTEDHLICAKILSFKTESTVMHVP